MRAHMATYGLVLGLMTQACGGAAVPHEQMTAAEASVRAADVGGAQASPQAELRLKQARDQIEEAKKSIAEGENEKAYYILLRAESDAELALALAEEESAKTQALEALKRIQKLMGEAQS